jgi:nucleotide-binding universal stress UspA family protein
MIAKKILVATDFSQPSLAALEYATALAGDCRAVLYIVHVGRLPAFRAAPFTAQAGPATPAEDDGWQQARDQLTKIAPSGAGFCYEHHYLEGDPAEEIVDFARRNDIDLIVMGTHGRTGLDHIALGSVAEAVIRRADCPVLTIKHSAQTTNPVASVMGRSLHAVASQARHRSSELVTHSQLASRTANKPTTDQEG